MKTRQACILFAVLFYSNIFSAIAQPGEKRIQYPAGLKNAYFGFSLGYINYPFSFAQLEPGFTAESVTVPHIAPRLVLYGYEFNKYLAAQITYMRPVDWVGYKSINGDQAIRTVWMNVGGLTLVGNIPLHNKLSLYAEGGLGVVTRKGIYINDVPAVKNAEYATGLFGAGFKYHLNHKWELLLGATLLPAHAKEKQPQTTFFSAGFNYHLRELSKEKVESVIKSGYHFPKHFINVAYTSNALGYGVNDLFSKTLPFFWGGDAHVRSGISVNYQRNIFHARKVFAFDIGTTVGYWKSEDNKEGFATLSVYPVLKFAAFRSKKTDVYFEYSVAGPTYISRTLIDDEKTGRHFTFHDQMGVECFYRQKQKPANRYQNRPFLQWQYFSG